MCGRRLIFFVRCSIEQFVNCLVDLPAYYPL